MDDLREFISKVAELGELRIIEGANWDLEIGAATYAALGLESYMTKFIIVVDEDVDPSNLRHVLWAVGLRSEPEEWEVVKGTWSGYLDPLLSPQKRELRDTTHSTEIILACKPYYWIKDFPPAVKEDPELEERIKKRWGKILI